MAWRTGLRAGTGQQGMWIRGTAPGKRVNLISPPLANQCNRLTIYTMTHDKIRFRENQPLRCGSNSTNKGKGERLNEKKARSVEVNEPFLVY